MSKICYNSACNHGMETAGCSAAENCPYFMDDPNRFYTTNAIPSESVSWTVSTSAAPIKEGK